MIYYDIQAHGACAGITNLVSLLDNGLNKICVSIDADDDVFYQLKIQLVTDLVNVKNSPALSWGGYSITQQMFSSLKRALEKPNWEYYVNLSGGCIPLKSQNDIYTQLKKNELDGVFNYCYSFSPLREKSYYLDDASAAFQEKINYGRVVINTNRKFANEINKGFFNPTKNVMHRVGARFDEVNKNSFNLRALTLNELHWRHDFINKNSLNVGRQWVILHRRTLEWLVDSKYITELLRFCQEIFISDEFFFPMALFNDESPFKVNTSKNPFRANMGGGGINSKNIAQLIASEDFFGRKLVAGNDIIYDKLRSEFDGV